MRHTSLLLSSLALAQCSTAGLLNARQDTTSATARTGTATTTTSEATAGLVETTIDGKATTLQVAVPTGDVADETTSTPTVKTATALAPVATDIGTGSSALLSCKAPTGSPLCLPNNATQVNVGDTYYVTWDPSRFEVNTTITILLNYANDTDNGNRVAWTSDGTPREKGFVTVKMDDSWRKGTRNATLEFALIAYQPVSEHTARPVDGPTVFLSKSSSHYPPPPTTKLPDNVSLYVGVPLGVGGLIFVLLGLYFGMRKHRHIDIKGIMARRNRGYGARKSRRERLGLKKGVIRLEEREVADPVEDYRNARDIYSAPGLSGDGGKYGGNAFRNEIEKQNIGRRGMI
ncbi:uncharacterized protein PV09_02784 [Verruconis gallopava]|uniref:Uncharacterized protein n=1 Tax=Verruconis gallopava TaxID=253628 RepID=A0A0D2AIC2_9PEZI|nr:uncharacterized protein PV09_02784 [Verruconis gallopava]KIW06320.1 hypothetical protein PV09_02784 [Verruconis gallopava]